MKSIVTIFYSWQSDDSKTRNCIEDSLEKAVKKLNSAQNNYEYRIDKDTRGEAGSPRIAQTIEEKIQKADIFVGDVSIIDASKQRKYANANVILETGYALSKLGEKRTVLIFNEEKGQIEDLPFDLRHRRISKIQIGDKEKLASFFVSAIELSMKAVNISEKIKKDTGYEVDDEELKILKVINSTGRKQVFIMKLLTGRKFGANSPIKQKDLFEEVNNWNKERLQANLDSLVEKRILRRKETDDSYTIFYALAKKGFEICDALSL